MPSVFHRTVQHIAAMVFQDFGYNVTLEDKAEQDRVLKPMRPDLVARFRGSASKAEASHRKRIVYLEAQTPPITTEWLEKIARNYAGLNVIIVNLGKMNLATVTILSNRCLPNYLTFNLTSRQTPKRKKKR